MKEVYVIICDEKVNNCIYSSKEEAEAAINHICSTIEIWYQDCPIKVENIKIITLYEYIRDLKKLSNGVE